MGHREDLTLALHCLDSIEGAAQPLGLKLYKLDVQPTNPGGEVMSEPHYSYCADCDTIIGQCEDSCTEEHEGETELCSECEDNQDAIEQNTKVAALMAAVKYNLLAQIDRGEHLDGESLTPHNEFAVLYTAYAAMGGNLKQFSDNTENWPEWEQGLAAECAIVLQQEDE